MLQNEPQAFSRLSLEIPHPAPPDEGLSRDLYCLHQGWTCGSSWTIRCIEGLAGATGKEVFFLWNDKLEVIRDPDAGDWCGREFQPPGGQGLLGNDVCIPESRAETWRSAQVHCDPPAPVFAGLNVNVSFIA